MRKNWFRCPQCGTLFQEYAELGSLAQCPRCLCLGQPCLP